MKNVLVAILLMIITIILTITCIDALCPRFTLLYKADGKGGYTLLGIRDNESSLIYDVRLTEQRIKYDVDYVAETCQIVDQKLKCD